MVFRRMALGKSIELKVSLSDGPSLYLSDELDRLMDIKNKFTYKEQRLNNFVHAMVRYVTGRSWNDMVPKHSMLLN